MTGILPIFFPTIIWYHILEKRVVSEEIFDLIGETSSFARFIRIQELSILFFELFEVFEVFLYFLLICLGKRRILVVIFSSDRIV